jgi:hypothetical protein
MLLIIHRILYFSVLLFSVFLFLFLLCEHTHVCILFYNDEIFMSIAVSCCIWSALVTAIYVCKISVINVTPTEECVILVALYASSQNTYLTYSTVLNSFNFMSVIYDF